MSDLIYRLPTVSRSTVVRSSAAPEENQANSQESNLVSLIVLQQWEMFVIIINVHVYVYN